MGNTPSHQQNTAQRQGPPSNAPHRHPSLRLHMPQHHISPSHSGNTSPSGRPGSPRRRKSLELPDLNKLQFTPAAFSPAAPVPTTHTHTSHHLAPSTTAVRKESPPITPTANVNNRRWRDTLGGKASPLAGQNTLAAMSKLEPPISGSSSGQTSKGGASDVNPYFPDPYGVQDPTAGTHPSKAVPIPIPGKEPPRAEPQEVPLPRPQVAEHDSGPPVQQGFTEGPVEEKGDGLVDVPIQWNGGGRNVYVAGTWEGGWANRIKLRKSTHDFNTTLRLPPGQYRVKFIVDESWRCSKQISTATDDDGTLVNWIEVEAPKTAEELKAEWAMDSKPAVKEEQTDESEWTGEIPPSLIMYQYIEELPLRMEQDELHNFLKSVPYIPNVPAPPTLPRILDKVIVNNDSKRLWDNHDPKAAAQTGWQSNPPAGLDDNSILAVPNHVVLNHLTASAIRNGTLGVGTTTRYRKKYITTMFFRDQPSSAEQQQAAEQPHLEPVPQPGS
ncbi:hypothetical protein L198_06764 [Cryptococcus wingfieldii CBS 7118]|uniref:Association with the SNF1 complex (ASC) domain-containing protein n=1 Tax=Cryptococcus wingfieldii CBS 7118 TaxID=1295528 RepID=A0A1E3IIR7_9TREE|nr:hypothetical protein L198_06764 [Cryptococcus wingfieldii CBS 7118]ODN88492.1 hypothetical protein L198_06764 [Cryptococcus wingfieldii CBS 7118]